MRQASIAENVNAEKQVEERLSMLISTLYPGLKDEVFDAEAVTAIGHTRTVLNLPDIACRLKGSDGGHMKVAVTEGPLFVEAVRAVPVRSLNNVSDDELKKQYKEFLKRLEVSTVQYSIDQLRATDPKDIRKLFSIQKMFFSMKLKWSCKPSVFAALKSLANQYGSLSCRSSRTITMSGGT